MANDLPQQTIESIVDALTQSDKATAILRAYRSGGGGLEDAWQAVQTILIDLGEDADDQPENAIGDPAYLETRDYLASAAGSRWRAPVRSTLALALLIVAAVVLVRYSARLVISLRSFTWPSAEAAVVKSKTYAESRSTQRGHSRQTYMDFVFRYEVDGREYTGSRHRVQYHELFGGKPLGPGDSITIFYNPRNPAHVIYQRRIYKTLLAIFAGICMLVAGTFWTWYERSRYKSGKKLRSVDPGL